MNTLEDQDEPIEALAMNKRPTNEGVYLEWIDPKGAYHSRMIDTGTAVPDVKIVTRPGIDARFNSEGGYAINISD